MLRNRKLLVLDEPTSGLDGKHMRIIAAVLRDVAKPVSYTHLDVYKSKDILRAALL